MGKKMYPESFIERVKEERAKNLLTIEEIATKFSIGSATVKRWTKGEEQGTPRRGLKPAKQREVKVREPRRTGRRPTFGSDDEIMLGKIGEKGYGEAQTFAKWLNAVALKRPNVAISTALAFFARWWDGRSSADIQASTEVTTEVETEVVTEIEGESSGEDAGDVAATGEPDALEGDEGEEPLESQGEGGDEGESVEDYEVVAQT